MKNKNFYAVILAGGSGTRFWPMSRHSKPKQFLNITGEGTLLELTLKRLKRKISCENILIVTNKLFAKDVKAHLKPYGIPARNILFEPSGKNTAPAICWAASTIAARDKNAVMAVFPSDHLIMHEKRFHHILDEALELSKNNYLVAFGIKPTRPDTGFGYLRTKKLKAGDSHVLKVVKFTEKPSLAKANAFLKSPDYLWNSGMYLFGVENILEDFKHYLPAISRLLGKKYSPAHIKRVWSQLPSISIDYGIMEKAKNVMAVVAKDIGWSDLGSWDSLYDILTEQKSRHMIRGSVLHVDSCNNLIWSHKKLIACVGLSDVIVIDTDDSLLICKKGASQNIRSVVGLLQKQNKSLL